MKKPKVGLLTKIILLTGLLTILTVSTSLAVNLLISYNDKRNSYVASCTTVTDSLESVFIANSDSKAKTVDILDIVIDSYDTVKNDYDTLTPEQVSEYQNDLTINLFGPSDGSFGMTMEKATRKAFYSESLSNMQFFCSQSEVPVATFTLFDVEKQRVIEVLNTNISDNDSSTNIMEKNLARIGLVGKKASKQELEFFNGTKNFETFITNDLVYSYNLVEIDIGRTGYKCFVQGQYLLTSFTKDFTRQLVAQLIITIASAVFLVIVYSIFAKFFLIRNVDKLTDSTERLVEKL
jgi:hypothetical protein